MDVTWEFPPAPPEEAPIPGANRRNWVYREMAMLGAEAMLGLEALLWLQDVDDNQSSASAESDASPIRRQFSSR